ncbi:30S ribosomal protein S5 [Patescibacteria group bacterium]|nr:30S ribosomal protein S5 [Patescibacteria group bacterium]
MTDPTVQKEAEETQNDTVTAVPADTAAVASTGATPGKERSQAPRGRRGGAGTGGGRRGRPSSARSRQPRSEFEQHLISIRRVSRVVAGGRRFSFSVSIIIGNKKGRVGVGVGKAGDTTLAIDKAARAAKKHLITVRLTKENTIAHEVAAKFCASRVSLMPAPGRGLVAGSSVRPVLELAGITNIVAKINSGSKNGLNNARAAVSALQALKA